MDRLCTNIMIFSFQNLNYIKNNKIHDINRFINIYKYL